jgi:hypothetical protein
VDRWPVVATACVRLRVNCTLGTHKASQFDQRPRDSDTTLTVLVMSQRHHTKLESTMSAPAAKVSAHKLKRTKRWVARASGTPSKHGSTRCRVEPGVGEMGLCYWRRKLSIAFLSASASTSQLIASVHRPRVALFDSTPAPSSSALARALLPHRQLSIAMQGGCTGRCV